MNNEKKCSNGGNRKNALLKSKIQIVTVVLFLLIVGLISCGCIKSEDSVDNRFKKDVVMDNMDDEIKNMQIETPEQCKEKGLHYIGKMKASRYMANVSKINQNELLIVGGLNLDYIGRRLGESVRKIDVSSYKELSAEIFDINTFRTELLKNNPYSWHHPYSLQLTNGNILFPGETMEVYLKELRKFKKLNIENYNDTYCDCVNYDKEKVLCIYNSYLKGDTLKSILFNYNENSNPKNVPILDSLINKNELFRFSSKLLKINNENIIIYSYYYLDKATKLYFYKFDKEQQIFTKITDIELDGNDFAVRKISDELILIDSYNKNDKVSNFYLYNLNKNQILNKFTLEQQYFTLELEDRNILLYNRSKNQYYIGYIFNSKLLKLMPINQKIIIPTRFSSVYPLNKKQLLFIGGKLPLGNMATNDIYLYTF